MVDIDRIINNLASEHNYIINKDDPVIDVLYLNRAIFEDYVDSITSKINESINDIGINEERVSRKLVKLLHDGHAAQNSAIERTLLRHIDDMNAVLAQTPHQQENKSSSNSILWLITAFLLGLALGGAVMHYFSH